MRDGGSGIAKVAKMLPAYETVVLVITANLGVQLACGVDLDSQLEPCHWPSLSAPCNSSSRRAGPRSATPQTCPRRRPASDGGMRANDISFLAGPKMGDQIL